MSSAYSDIVSHPLPNLIPHQACLLRINEIKGSVAMAKSRGDSGHPCLLAHKTAKGVEKDPLIGTLAVGFTYRKLAHAFSVSNRTATVGRSRSTRCNTPISVRKL